MADFDEKFDEFNKHRKNNGSYTDQGYIHTLKNFNVDDLVIDKDKGFDSSIVIYGPRRTGKSTLLLDLLTKLQKMKVIGRIAVITSTEMNQFYKVHIPDATTFSVEQAGDTCEKIMEFMKYLIIEDVDDDILRQYTIILEDFSWNKDFSIYDKTFAKLFTTARHYNIAVFILLQNPTGAMNWVRNNADFAFILKTPGFQQKERIWADQLDFMVKKDAFKFIDDNTMDYETIVVKRTDPNASIEDRVLKYKAELIDVDPTPKKMKKRTQFGDKKWRKKMEEQQYQKPKKTFNFRRGSEAKFYDMNDAFKTGGGINSTYFKAYINSLSNNDNE